jgi:hypothetical protein
MRQALMQSIKESLKLIFRGLAFLVRRSFWVWLVYHYQRIITGKSFLDMQFTYGLKLVLLLIQVFSLVGLFSLGVISLRDSALIVGTFYFFLHRLGFLSYVCRIYLISNYFIGA